MIAVVLCLTGFSAAPTLAQGVNGGVEGGLSLSRVSPDAAGQAISRGPGALVGGWIQFQPWVPVGIQFELIYAQKHSHLSGTSDMKLDYVEVPVLAKLKLFKSIYMLEGVAVGFPVRATVTGSGSDLDIKDNVTSPDIGMVIAGGIPVSPRVAVEFRYEGGFKKVDTRSAFVQRNRSLSGIVRIKL
jgi:hypothetical protein